MTSYYSKDVQYSVLEYLIHVYRLITANISYEPCEHREKIAIERGKGFGRYDCHFQAASERGIMGFVNDTNRINSL